jgi:beta-glucosidase
MANRTYRYFTGQALFPFGFGLSYTKFDYGKPSLSTKTVRPEGTFTVKVPVTNTGGADGDEVVQAYVKHPESPVSQPIHSLCAFARVPVRKGATAGATLTINTREFRYWDTSTKSYVISPGAYTIQIGASSTDIRQTGTVAVTP